MSYICMVVDGAYPKDIRVRKEAEALAKSCKKILVVCPAKENEKSDETINGVTVFRIGKNYTHTKKGFNDIVESVINVNPFFYFGLRTVFKKYKIDCLHVHDLPLAGTCYLFKSKVKYKLILDLHENYPEALKTWFQWKKNRLIRWKNALFMNPKQWSIKEEKYCKKYDKIICVVSEMKEKLLSKFNLDTSKLYVISNHEEKNFVHNFNTKVVQDIIDKTSFSITYVGGFGPHRGLDTAILAMPAIIKAIPNVHLFLVGKGSRDVELKLQTMVATNNLEQQVHFVGYRPFEEVATIMQLSKLNIIPHKANEHTNNTIPHKLFQIMMSKSLLLVSSCRPLKRIVERYDAGLVFRADDSKDFATKVIDAEANYQALKYKTENAFDAVMNKGENWEEESKKLIDLYNDLES